MSVERRTYSFNQGLALAHHDTIPMGPMETSFPRHRLVRGLEGRGLSRDPDQKKVHLQEPFISHQMQLYILHNVNFQWLFCWNSLILSFWFRIPTHMPPASLSSLVLM